MLKKENKKIWRNLTAVALLSKVFFIGCGRAYTSMPPENVEDITPAQVTAGPVDYGSMNWKEAIEYIKTPKQAQDYLDNHMEWNPSSVGESFRLNHEDGEGDCLDYSVTPSALLSDNSYTPNLLTMKGGQEDHCVFLYKKDNMYGALGITPLDPLYSSVEDLVRKQSEIVGYEFEGYAIVDLDETFPHNEWISGTTNLELEYIYGLIYLD